MVNPPGTLLTVSALAFAGGAACAAAAGAAIFLGATRLPPRIAPARVWAEWRRRRALWGGSLLLGALGAAASGELFAYRIGLRDLYWLGRAEELFLIVRLGAASGFLLALLLLVLAGLAGARRRVRIPETPRHRAAVTTGERRRTDDAILETAGRGDADPRGGGGRGARH